MKRDRRNNPDQLPISLNLGGLLKLGDTPRPPAGSILHLFFNGLEKTIHFILVIRVRVQLKWHM